MEESPPVVIPRLYEELRARAKRLRRNAALVLAIIVAVLITGIAVFVGAGTLANRETTTAIEDERRSILQTLLDRQTSFSIEQVRLDAQIDTKRRELASEVAGKGLSGAYGRGPVAANIERQLISLQNQREQLDRDLSQTRQSIDRVQAQLASPSPTVPKEAQMLSLISTLSTRIGAVVLLLFLVQILVPLYRYTAKLASYYDARADVLLLLESQPVAATGFVELVHALSPDAVHFGATPDAPTEHVLAIVKEVLARRYNSGAGNAG